MGEPQSLQPGYNLKNNTLDRSANLPTKHLFDGQISEYRKNMLFKFNLNPIFRPFYNIFFVSYSVFFSALLFLPAQGVRSDLQAWQKAEETTDI